MLNDDNEQHGCVVFCVNLRKEGKNLCQKTKFQNIIFTLIMAFIMVYAMICYNISLNKGQVSNEVFLLAFHEMVIMWPAAFVLDVFAVETCDKACIQIYKTGS